MCNRAYVCGVLYHFDEVSGIDIRFFKDQKRLMQE